MIESIAFHYNMIMDLHKKYNAVHGRLLEIHGKERPAVWRYENVSFSEELNDNLKCTVRVSDTNASISFYSRSFYKGEEQSFCTLTKSGSALVSSNDISTFNGSWLDLSFNYEDLSLFGITTVTNTLIKLCDTYDEDILEACEFQYLTKYSTTETAAILLAQTLVCDIKDCEWLTVWMPAYTGLDAGRYAALNEAYKKTVLGLQYEIDKIM